jgi:hypothetical protein
MPEEDNVADAVKAQDRVFCDGHQEKQEWWHKHWQKCGKCGGYPRYGK